MTIKLQLSKYELDALVLCSSRDDTRVHLNSVLFDGALGVCVATDGHRIGIRSSEPFDGSFLIARSSLELVQKLISRKGAAHFSKSGITVFSALQEELATVKPKLVDAQFPPYHQVIGAYGANAQLTAIALNPKLMADACKVFGSLPGRWQGMALAGKGALDPIELTAQDRETLAWWHVIIMPMRVDAEETFLRTAELKRRVTPEEKPVKKGAKK